MFRSFFRMSKQVGAKRQQKRHEPGTLQQAIDAIQCKAMSMREASRMYGIPRTTLYDKVNNRTSVTPERKTVLSPTEEQKLVDWALRMARIGFGRTRKEILDTVKRIVETDQRTTGPNRTTPYLVICICLDTCWDQNKTNIMFLCGSMPYKHSTWNTFSINTWRRVIPKTKMSQYMLQLKIPAEKEQFIQQRSGLKLHVNEMKMSSLTTFNKLQNT